MAVADPRVLAVGSDPTADPMVPDWSFFIKAPGSTQITIFCVTGTLDASLVDQNRDLMVFAQDLVISGPLSLPGRRVRIL
jgi:hypothetical protein